MPNPKTQSSLVSSITDQPVLVAPESEGLFASLMQELSASEEFGTLYDTSHATSAKMQDDDGFWDEDDWMAKNYRPYNVVNGVLQIPVFGVLLNRFSFQFGRRATGYQYIERAFQRGMDDSNVNAIALIVDSPGGEVAGNFELVEKMNDRDFSKTLKAFAADHAYSAAYSIATAAEEIVITRSGGVGSVGVVVAHVEFSEMYKDIGIKVTFIHAGKHKVDGNPHEKLSSDAKTRIQTKVDRIYGEFVALVADNRSMDEKAVRDTEALTYDASDAIQVGFADRVGALEEELATFAEEAAEPETEFMTTKPKAAPAANNDDGQASATITQDQHDAALSAATDEGASGERTRISAILDSKEGKARPKAALSAAMKTSMTSDEAIAFLNDLPEEKAEEPAPAAAPTGEAPTTPKVVAPTGFDQAMNASGNPEVGSEEASEEPNNSESMLSALSAATGRPRKQLTH